MKSVGWLFNVFHVRALYHTKTQITNKCTKRVLSSIVIHSYMFRPCWAIFRENFPLPLHWGCTLQLSENVLLTVYCIVFGDENPPRSGPGRGRNMQECVTIDDKTLFVHLLVISVLVGWLYMGWYSVAQYKVQYLATVNRIMNLRVP
jgi:hypothetical protein